jgi:hypothetical protein
MDDDHHIKREGDEAEGAAAADGAKAREAAERTCVVMV